MSEKKIPGDRIKQLRLAANLTLKDVEGKAKVSATHVSEIERGLTSPTVGALVRIAGALGVSPALLMETPQLRPVDVVRSGERRALGVVGTGVELSVLSSGGEDLSLVEISVEAGSGDVALPLVSGEVFLHVLEGAMELVRDGERHALMQGDSIHAASDGPALVANPGPARARFLCATAPAVRL
jgi:transcriptional regulator with XRE-family HTH domain